MNDESESVSDDRVRLALRDLAAGARVEPSRPVHVGATGGSASGEAPWRRGAMAAAVVVLVVTAVALVAARSPDQTVFDGTAPSGWFTDLAPDSAAVLPDAPISGRVGPASAWSGTEMLVWGGSDLVDGVEVPMSDGAGFDPVTGRWRLLPEAPIEGRAYAATVWTGTEMIVWGGSQSGALVGDGAAFDPATNEWRTLASSPIGPATKSAAAWTGREMIVVGGLNGDGSAAAYDPAADVWRRLADAPGPVTPPYPLAVWTGEAVLTTVTVGQLDQRVALAMYRPDDDRWDVVQDDFPSQFLVGVPGVELGMVGDEVVALTFSSDTDIPVLDVFGDIGSALLPAPDDLAGVGVWQPIWSGHEILLWSGGDTGLALDPVTDQWREFPAGGTAARTDAAIVWADGVLLAWGGFTTNGDGTASADGVIYRPVIPPADTGPTTTPPPVDTRAGCPDDHPGSWTAGGDGFTDYFDSVRVNGRLYEEATSTSLQPEQLGELVGRVCFTLDDMTFDGPTPRQDGDATFLPVGTELRAIPGSNPDLRIAAVDDGAVTVYEVERG